MKKNKLTKSIMAIIAIVALMAGPALGQEEGQRKFYTVPDKGQQVEKPKPYSPYVDQHFPQRVYFGDTHHHTSYSFDCGLTGNILGPEESFRFALGEEIITSTGLRAQLNKPLDFLVVSDHAEYLGLAELINTANAEFLAVEAGRELYDAVQKGGDAGWSATMDIMRDMQAGNPRIDLSKVKRPVWERVVDIASEYNQPGVFTAFNGYEYSPLPNGNNLHRVVIYRDGPDRVKQLIPFSAFDSQDPEDLWAFMAGYEDKTGGQILAIPHNANMSNGVVFAETVNGKAMTRDYAERRARWEPLAEVTQMKGDGEAHPFLSPEDEFADFETWDAINLIGVPKEDRMLKYEYARSALRIGLRLEQKLGTNPFKFGMIGSTDTHISASTTREDNFFGKLPHIEPSNHRTDVALVRDLDKKPVITAWEMSASGLCAVWARENTRESLFDAMTRKEVYATTGSRIMVRVFAGWDFKADEVETQGFAREGYARGVPMGGDLTDAPKGEAPKFMIRALRDPDNANLDRIQIIKGWLDEKGETHERIYDVAVSDDRTIGKDGRCKTPVGSTVDVPDASYTNTIGDPLLTAFWEDPDFDPKQSAFYYVRVIEIPKPRWTAYDAKFFGIKMADEVRMTVQDRAYTSPIWYNPE